MVMLSYAAPSTCLAISISNITLVPSCSTSATGASRALTSVYPVDAVATTGGTISIDTIVTLAPLLLASGATSTGS
jgi:hypothetical protein